MNCLNAKSPIQLALEACLPVKVKNGDVLVRCSDETAKYLASPHTEIRVGPFCRCRSFRLPHLPARHRELRYGDLDWRSAEERGDIGERPEPPHRRESAPDVPEEILQQWYA